MLCGCLHSQQGRQLWMLFDISVPMHLACITVIPYDAVAAWCVQSLLYHCTKEIVAAGLILHRI